MITKIPQQVIHGLVSRLKQRVGVEALEKMEALLAGEHDLDRALTFIVPGFQNFEFHVMIRRVMHKPESDLIGLDLPEFPRWQTVILVVTKQIGFLYDEVPDVKISVSSEPPPGIADPERN